MSANILANDSATQARTRTTLHTRQRARRSVRPLLAALLIACCVTSLPAASQALDDDNLLLLDFNLERQRLASSVTAYSFGDTAVVSLVEVAAALEFPIAVEPERGTASGWFIRPDRTFRLDFDGRYVDVDGQRQPFSANEVFLYEDAIFVELSVLSRWFPVNLALDESTLSVHVEPREPLPMQLRQERRGSAGMMRGIGPATLPLVDMPYRFIGPHAADVGIGYSIRRHKGSNRPVTGLNYSALLAGDLAFMDSRIYLGGQRDDALTYARVNLSRSDLDLPLGLRHVEIGDISPVTIPGLSYGGVERGFMIQGGGSVVGRDDIIGDGTITLSGDGLEGWDVEAFLGGMRVGMQTIGPDGRYEFRDIEPLAGENVFELVFHGPSGEQRTETVVRYSGLQPDQPGSVRYQFSASEAGRPLYESGDVERPLRLDEGSTRLAAGVEVRVLPRLSVRGGWNSVVVDGERIDYRSVGVRTGWGGLGLSVDAIHDPDRGTRWDGVAQLPASANLFGFDTRFSHTHYARTALIDDQYDTRIESRTGLTLQRPFGSTATRFSVFHNRGEARNWTTFSGGLTHRLDRVTFGNTLSYTRFGRDSGGNRRAEVLDGNLFFSVAAYPLSVRGGVNYSLRPDARAERYFIESNLRVADDMAMHFGVDHNPGLNSSGRLTRFTAGLNWRLPQVTLSPRLSYDSGGNYSGFVYASFSLAPRPGGGMLISGRSLATGGAVTARAFIDHDGSGTFTEGDEPLPGVTIEAPQASRRVETGSDGVALLSSMPSSQATDIRVDPSSLPRADLVSVHPGNSVRPRPTAIAMIEFPVVPTGTIEGHVYQLRDDGRISVPGVTLELLDARGALATTQVSAYDGYYVFEEVPYGEYTVTVAGARVERLRRAPAVRVSRERSAVTDVDLELDAEVTPSLPAGRPADMPPTPPSIVPPAGTGSMRLPAATASPAVAPSAVPALAADPRIATTGASTASREALARAPASARAERAARNGELPPGSDGRLVQLGAFSDPERARSQLDGIVARGLLKAEQVAVVKPDVSSANGLHRILASPSEGSARRLCESLSARGQSCFTVAR